MIKLCVFHQYTALFLGSHNKSALSFILPFLFHHFPPHSSVSLVFRCGPRAGEEALPVFFFSSASRPALVPSKAHQRAPFIVPRSHHAHVATQTHQKPSGWSWNRRQRSLFPPPPSPAPPLTPPCVSPTRYRERRGKGGYILRYFINSNNIMTYKQEQLSLYSLSVEVYYCVISAAQPCRSAAISRLF